MNSSSDLHVRYVAQLARLKLSEEEACRYQDQLEQIVRYIEQIRKLDVRGIEPTAHVVERVNPMRADDPAPSLSPDDATANAPLRAEHLFMVPKVVE